MVQRLQHFVMTNKDVLVHALNSGKILQELTEKSLLKQPAQYILWVFNKVNMVFFLFCMY